MILFFNINLKSILVHAEVLHLAYDDVDTVDDDGCRGGEGKDDDGDDDCCHDYGEMMVEMIMVIVEMTMVMHAMEKLMKRMMNSMVYVMKSYCN